MTGNSRGIRPHRFARAKRKLPSERGCGDKVPVVVRGSKVTAHVEPVHSTERSLIYGFAPRKRTHGGKAVSKVLLDPGLKTVIVAAQHGPPEQQVLSPAELVEKRFSRVQRSGARDSGIRVTAGPFISPYVSYIGEFNSRVTAKHVLDR